MDSAGGAEEEGAGRGWRGRWLQRQEGWWPDDGPSAPEPLQVAFELPRSGSLKELAL